MFTICYGVGFLSDAIVVTDPNLVKELSPSMFADKIVIDLVRCLRIKKPSALLWDCVVIKNNKISSICIITQYYSPETGAAQIRLATWEEF